MKKVIPLAILALIIVPAYVVAARSDSLSGPKPSVVLVHGAWADGSSWSGVVARPTDQGDTRYAATNPSPGSASYSSKPATFLPSTTRPLLLVGVPYRSPLLT